MVKNNKIKNHRGEFSSEIYSKDNVFVGKHNLKDGDEYYTVWLTNDNTGIDILDKEHAIIIAGQFRIENKLDTLLTKINSYEKEINMDKIKDILKMI
jgi:uncharacterized protein (UPF0128 family)